MGKTSIFKKISASFYVFLAVALAFLAVGLGTLGSSETVGADYELGRTADVNNSSSGPSVIFELPSSSSIKDENGNSVTVRVVDVLVNVGAVYSESGEGTLEMIRGSSDTSFYSYYKLEGGTVRGWSGEDAGDSFSWISPFTLDESGYQLGSYRYYRLRALDCTVRINEVIFIGAKMDGGDLTDEHIIIPAKIRVATPAVNQSAEDANAAAAALLDAQAMPSEVQSSYFRYTDEEKGILLSLAEMRAGNRYLRQGENTSESLVKAGEYRGDRVYGALGLDFLALGTAIFGVTPFGLRFFPMLFSFGILVVGALLVKRLSKSETGMLIFAVLYALCGVGISLGHLGAPLMIGAFFLVASLALVHRFYAAGMKHASITGLLPLLAAGLCSAAAICVNGAFVLPVAGVCALFALGVVRLRKARRFYLDIAIEKAVSAEGSQPAAQDELTPEQQAGKIAAEYRYKTVGSVVAFSASLLLGTLIFSLVFMLPAYFAFAKLYDDLAHPALNVFGLAWYSFAGGFAGSAPSVWDWFCKLFTGSGSVYAVTAAVVNCAAALAGLFGIVYAAVRIALAVKNRAKEGGRKELRVTLRRTLVPLAGMILSLAAASFAGGGLAFVFLGYVFSFMMGADGAVHLLSRGGKCRTGALVSVWTGLGLLAAVFALFAVFTFSIPLPAGFLSALGL